MLYLSGSMLLISVIPNVQMEFDDNADKKFIKSRRARNIWNLERWR